MKTEWALRPAAGIEEARPQGQRAGPRQQKRATLEAPFLWLWPGLLNAD